MAKVGKHGPVPNGTKLNLVAKNITGRCDRSLARSARKAPPQKIRPVGYGVILAAVRTNRSRTSVALHGRLSLLKKQGARFDKKYLRN
jgi:hypothetical protein